MALSFCESVQAPPNGRWHIRELSAKGPKYGGGADTPALCGRDLRGGWDLEVPYSEQHFDQCCAKCVASVRRRGREGGRG